MYEFSLRDSLDENCVFAGLKKFDLNEFLQSKIMNKLCSVQNLTNIIAVADVYNQVQFVCLWGCAPSDFVFQKKILSAWFCFLL